MEIKFKMTPQQVYNTLTSYSKQNKSLSENPYFSAELRQFHWDRYQYQEDLIEMLLEIEE
jgi:hypothetical protein